MVKTEACAESKPADPVAELTAKAQDDTACGKSATGDYAKLVGLLFAPSDVRPVVPLSKAASSSSAWSWDAPVSDTLEKRAHGTAREKFRRELEKFFAGHNEEFWEALEVCNRAVEDEKASILAGEV
jgi:hypothetical protein